MCIYIKLLLFLCVVYQMRITESSKITDGSDSPCCQPIDPGPCRAAILRYAYDSEKQECVQFNYGNCKGNANIFKTLEECEDMCNPQLPLS